VALSFQGAAQGASAGSAAGPYGAIAGGIIGAFAGGGGKTSAYGVGYRATGTVTASGFSGTILGISNKGTEPLADQSGHGAAIGNRARPVFEEYFGSSGRAIPVDVTTGLDIGALYASVVETVRAWGAAEGKTSGAAKMEAPTINNANVTAPASSAAAPAAASGNGNPALVWGVILGVVVWALSK